MKQIKNHFKKYDPTLYTYIRTLDKYIEPIQKEKPENYFFRLCREIICQQLSGKSGDAIFGRFIQLFPNKIPQPADIVSIQHETLRAVGMSHAKVRYIRSLAENTINGNVQIHLLDSLPDEEIIRELTKVKGIGQWTSEMFLIFALGRNNVFSYGDLGLKKGLMKVYGFKKVPTKRQIEKIISAWSPYKSYASRILWACLDT